MQKSTIASFMNLVLFDQSLLEYENQLDVLYDEMGRLENQKIIQGNFFIQKQNELSALKKYIKTCEQELNNAIEQEKKISQMHKDIHDKREYAALKKELDNFHVLQESLEKKLLTSFAQSEHLEKECHTLMQEKQEEAQSLDSLISECKAKIVTLEDTFEKAKQERDKLQQTIPDEWRLQYERMRQEVIDPLAFVLEDSCSKCFQTLTSYDRMQVMQGPLKCKGCYRFLCIRPE